MENLSERLESLTPEKRLLLEVLRREKRARANAADAAAGEVPGAAARPGRAPSTMPDEAVKTEPFSLVSDEDRARLPADVEDAYPLTVMQLGMLTHMELRADAPTPPAYHNVNSFHLKAPFDHKALQEAVDHVVARHAVLRTSFDLTNYAEPLQLVHRQAHLPVQVVDLRHLPAEERAAALQKFIEEENFKLFDLSRPPLLRYFVHRLTDETFQFTLVEPHSISDGWSTNLTLAEVGEHYDALLKGKPVPEEPPLEVTYRDFVHLERLTVANAECRGYWERRLSEWTNTKLPRWPAQFHTAPGLEDHKVAYMIPVETVEGLYRLARRARVPLKSVLFAAHLKVMAMVSSQQEVVTGLVFNSRPEVLGGDKVHGMYLNTLPLNFRLRRGTWLELVREAYDVEAEMTPYRRFPVAELQKRMGTRQLYESAFTFLHFHSVEGVLRSGTIEDLGYGGSDLSVTNFELMVLFTLSTLSPNRVGLQLQFNVNEFTKEQMRLVLGYYDRVMGSMAADPEARHEAQSLLPLRERQQLLGAWNSTAAENPREEPFARLFEAQAERTPGRTAVIAGDESLTYAELNGRAEALALRLRARGVGAETIVALLADRGIEFLVSVLAVFKAGGAYLPLDPAHPAQRIAGVLEGSGAHHVLTTERFEAVLGEALSRLDEARRPEVSTYEKLSEEAAPGEVLPPVEYAPEQLAYVIYTSGSTGVPKGVMVQSRGMVNHLYVKIEDLGISPADVVAQTASQTFDISVWQFLAALVVGGSVHIFDEATTHDPSQLLDAVEGAGVTIFEVVPSMLRMMLEEAGRRAPAHPPLESLRWLVPTGEELPPELCRQWLGLYPSTPLLNAYGPTECSDDVTHHAVERAPEPDVLRVPIGRPVQNTRLYVLDAWMQPCPVGVAGELYVGGAGVGRGYVGDAAKTAERFVPDGFGGEAGARLYRTGDVARWLPDGSVDFLGRADRQVKVRGFRIELGEIEAVLSAHPDLHECVVETFEETPGDRRLVAYFVAAADRRVEAGSLRAYLQVRLPEYMVPSVFMALERLPLTPNGKIDRKALPAPEPVETGQTYVAPRTPVEELLAAVWAEVLRVERVGVHDNFFDLGGHSLLAFQLVTRLRRALGVEVLLRHLFSAPTVESLAALVEQELKSDRRAAAPPLARVQRGGPLPLSYAQQRLFFLDQLEPESPAYNIPAAVRLEGELDAEALGRALEDLVRRHETLRTIFTRDDDEPRQVILEELPPQLDTLDLRALDAEEREAEASRLIDEEARRPFDLARGPLLRMRLLRLEDRQHVVLLTMHHIISDGWSMDVLIKELAALYESHATGAPAALAELPVQYADYAVWQRGWFESGALEEQLDYWRRRLQGVPEALELPTDYPRPAAQTFRGATASFDFPEDLTRDLRELCRREGATLYMTLLAGFSLLLQRYTGQTDIAVGSPIASRSTVELEKLIGFFANTLVLRTDLSGDPSFRELLGRVRESALGAYAHQEVPFEKLVEALQPRRDLSRTPLFQVMFVLQNRAVETIELSGLTLRPVSAERGAAKFDLTVTIEESTDELTGSIEYNADLFAPDTVARLASHFRTLLASALSSPDAPLSRLAMLAPAERHQVTRAFNDTYRPYPTSLLIHQLPRGHALRADSPAALTFRSRTLSYRELDRRSNQLARLLRRAGLGRGSLCALLLDRSHELVLCLLAAMKAGAAYLPLDVDSPPRRLSLMLAKARPSLLLTASHLRERLPADVAAPVLSLEEASGVWDEVARESDAPLDSHPDLGLSGLDPAYVIYTSGSTGEPKAAVNTHAAILNRLLWMQEALALSASDVVLQKTPYSFDVSVWEFCWPWVAGARLVLAEPGGHRDPHYLRELIRGEGVTTLHFVPSMLRAFLEAGGFEGCGCVRRVVCSGEALTRELAERFFEQAPGGARLYNLYGPTEAAVDVTWRECARGEAGAVPIGRPIGNVQVYVLGVGMEPAPVGVAGEIYLGGAGVGLGYLGRPAQTAERYVPDAFSEEGGARLYRTGDVGRWRGDGEVEYLGRLDGQVKVRGNRIELGEVEAAVAEVGWVRECAVVARPGASAGAAAGAAGAGAGAGAGAAAGGEEVRLVCYVAVREGEEGERARGAGLWGELRARLRERVPEYMVPAAFAEVERLPLTASGKVDRRALPEVSAGEAARGPGEYVGPRTGVEEVLAGIWQEVLGVERVGVHDNFFELGGDSILSMRVVARANKLGLPLVTRHLFQHQTVAELSTAIDEPAAGVVAEQGIVTGAVPLMPIQSWFFERGLTDAHHWNQAVMLESREPLEATVLYRVLAKLLAHHDALRLRFVRAGEGWRQVSPAVGRDVPFTQVDLSGLPEGAQLAHLKRAAHEAQASLDLSRGPLLRMVLFELGAGRPQRLLVAIHHLAVDAVSWRILLEDLQTAYEQARRGVEVRLPPKTTSFKGWAEKLAEAARGEDVARELAYWSDARRREVRPLPLDEQIGPEENTVASAQTVAVSLGADETRALLQDVPKAYRTQINDVLLTALAVALRRWTGAGEVLVDLEGHGREEDLFGADLSRTVGWFTSLYPVFLEAGGTDDLAESLRLVKEQLRGIPRRGLGYGLLRYAGGDADAAGALAAMPQAEVLFNYLGQFDEASAPAEKFARARESAGALYSPRGARPHLLEVVASIGGGSLHLHWTYSARAHRRATVEGLAREFVGALRALIERAGADDAARAHTPADFPLARIDERQLRGLLAARGAVEDVYALSPLQQGLLFHSLYQTNSEVYVIQLNVRLRGRLDPAAFERAWQTVVERHAVLRTSFVWEELDEPLQVVERRVSLGWQRLDWRGASQEEQQRRLLDFLASDRRQGFKVSRAPLMRLTLIEVGESEYEFVWSQHHLLLDGWSMPLVLNEVVECYEAYRRGAQPALAPVHPYRDYIEWLRLQDEAPAAEFWRGLLRGFTRPTRLRFERAAEGEGEERYEEQQLRVGRDVTEGLQRAARRHQLTLNTVLEGAWALLLGHYSGESEVVFGATVSGRPAALPGVETMVGMFINTLPLRVRLPREEVLADWLRRLQELQAEVLQHEQTPLVQVQGWSDVPRGAQLFDTIMTFENYPMPASPEGGEEGGGHGLEIVNTRYTTKTHYGLTLLVQPDEETSVKLLYDARRYDAAAVAGLLRQLNRLLRGFVAHDAEPLERVLALLAEGEAEERQQAETAREESRRRKLKGFARKTPGAKGGKDSPEGSSGAKNEPAAGEKHNSSSA